MSEKAIQRELQKHRLLLKFQQRLAHWNLNIKRPPIKFIHNFQTGTEPVIPVKVSISVFTLNAIHTKLSSAEL